MFLCLSVSILKLKQLLGAQRSAYCFSSINCSARAGFPFGSGASSYNPAVVPGHGTVEAGAQFLPASTDHLLPLLLLPCLTPSCSSLSVCPLPFPLHHNAPEDPERGFYPHCASGVWTSNMAVPCAPCITISAASQDTQILSPLLVTHSDIQEQPLQLKKIKFPALWSPFHHILCCRLGLWPYSTFTLLCGYRTIAQAVKWHRTWQSALAAFLLLSQSVLHPWAKDTFYCCSTANTWGCLCWVGKKPFFCLQRKVSLESLNSIWTLVNQRCGELIKIVVFIRCLSLTFL